MAGVEGIDEYRLDQESPKRVQLRLITAGNRPRQSVLRDAQETIHALLGDELEVTAEAVCCLLPEASGKFLLAKRHFPLDIGASPTRPGGLDGR
jgi:hypothetical protein